MTSAEDAEHAYDRARFGILSARAALMQFAAPLPDLTVTITDGQWEIVRKADAMAGEAERKMEEALEIIRTGPARLAAAGTAGRRRRRARGWLTTSANATT